LIEKNREYGKEKVIIINYNKVFDSMRKEEICKSLEKLGISTDLLRKVKNTHEKSVNCVKTDMGFSSWFETKSRVRQGSVLSL
jgi:hypothetical protein